MKFIVRPLQFLTVLIIVCGFLTSTRAELIDRGGGLIYDTDLNITWLQDANYAKTSGYHATGIMTWDEAMTWARKLVYAGLDGWRLPMTLQPDPSCSVQNGYLSRGYNCTGSEMGTLYYTALGNTAGLLTNTGPFINVPLTGGTASLGWWWSSTEYASLIGGDLDHAWSFAFQGGPYAGGQFGGDKSTSCIPSRSCFYAWAVRDGDVSDSAKPDLLVNIIESQDPLILGNNLTYTITITNPCCANITGAVLTDTLPSEVTFVSAAPSQGSCSGTGTITCNLGDLAEGSIATVKIVVMPTVVGAITNIANVAGNEAESSLTNNTATAVTTVNAPPPPGACTGTGTYSLIGKIEYQLGKLSGANIKLSGPYGCVSTTVTNSNGAYSFSMLGYGTYTVTPSKTGCTFKPVSRTLLIKEKAEAEFAAICQ
jgi:uncharacterized repeat protein (TIGR01451 family)